MALFDELRQIGSLVTNEADERYRVGAGSGIQAQDRPSPLETAAIPGPGTPRRWSAGWRITVGIAAAVLVATAIGLLLKADLTGSRSRHAASNRSSSVTSSTTQGATSTSLAASHGIQGVTPTSIAPLGGGSALGLPSGGTYVNLLFIPLTPISISSIPHYVLTLTVGTGGTVDGEIQMVYQDGKRSHVLSFAGTPDASARSIAIVTTAPTPGLTPGGVPESSLAVGSKISATYDGTSITFANCSTYLHWVSYAAAEAPGAANPKACTFTLQSSN